MKIIIVDDEIKRLESMIEDEDTSDFAKDFYKSLLTYVKNAGMEVESVGNESDSTTEVSLNKDKDEWYDNYYTCKSSDNDFMTKSFDQPKCCPYCGKRISKVIQR